MSFSPKHAFVSALLLGVGLSGCALTSKSDPIVPRFFSPDVTAPGTMVRVTSAPASATQRGPELRLGRVTAASHLREKIAYRSSTHELGYYEEQRWTERPDVFVRRALERRLFESGHFEHVVSGEAPTLDVEVVAFGEVRAARPYAEIELRVVLAEDRVVRYEETVTMHEELGDSSKGGERLARAMARAIARATDHVATRIRVNLQAPSDQRTR